MALTVIALLLFLAMVAAWVMLPGSMMALPMEDSADPMPASTPNTGGVTAPAS
jgi:hypothetical protein